MQSKLLVNTHADASPPVAAPSVQGEFETGFERGGQTREHAQLAKTLGEPRSSNIWLVAAAGFCGGCCAARVFSCCGLSPGSLGPSRCTAGVTKLVVAINKMDDHSVLDPSGKWSKERCVRGQSRAAAIAGGMVLPAGRSWQQPTRHAACSDATILCEGCFLRKLTVPAAAPSAGLTRLRAS